METRCLLIRLDFYLVVESVLNNILAVDRKDAIFYGRGWGTRWWREEEDGHLASAVHLAVNLATGWTVAKSGIHRHGRFCRCTIGDWWLYWWLYAARMRSLTISPTDGALRMIWGFFFSREHEYIRVAYISGGCGDFNGQRSINSRLWDSESFSRRRNSRVVLYVLVQYIIIGATQRYV